MPYRNTAAEAPHFRTYALRGNPLRFVSNRSLLAQREILQVASNFCSGICRCSCGTVASSETLGVNLRRAMSVVSPYGHQELRGEFQNNRFQNGHNIDKRRRVILDCILETGLKTVEISSMRFWKHGSDRSLTDQLEKPGNFLLCSLEKMLSPSL